MDIEDSFELEHLLFIERQCRNCGQTKNLLSDFYLTRKDRGSFPSSYSYECKDCTIKRIQKSRNKHKCPKNDYPDW